MLTGRYVRSTFVEDQREFVKQVNKSVNYWTCQNVPRPKNTFSVWNMKNLETWFQILKSLKNIIKMFTEILVQNGCDAFPNELMRFRFEATPSWDKIQKLCKNAVII